MKIMSYFWIIYPLSTTLSGRLDRVDHVRSHEKNLNLNDLDLFKLCGKENIKSKSIESKKHRKIKCQVKKYRRKRRLYVFILTRHISFQSFYIRYFHIQYFFESEKGW